MVIKAFQFDGNTAFTDDELSAAVAPFIGRPLTGAGLEAARNALSRHYIDAGYISSGAVLPDQTVADGVITFRLIEGTLSKLTITGNAALNEAYLRSRINLATEPPFNIIAVRNRLEVLRQSPVIDRINANVEPGGLPGEAQLNVAVTEAQPWHVDLQFDNHRSPSIGAGRLSLSAVHHSLLGFNDTFSMHWGITRNGLEDLEFAGIDDLSVAYVVPFTVYDTTVGVSYERTDTVVVEDAFEALDIQSETESFGVNIRHPFVRTPQTGFALAVAFEHRENESFLLGEPFSLSPGAMDGTSTVSVVRFRQEFVNRTQQEVIAARSTFSFGVDALDASTGPEADGRFITWLGQGQYVRRIGEGDSQLILRGTVQWSNNPLLTLEQFAIGGVDTVRGYRENQVVRDNGVVFSAEWRIPIIQDANGRGILHVAPFVDIGAGWNDNNGSDVIDLTSVGVGFLFNPDERLNVQFYWGYPFRDFDDPEDDPQDLGIHLSVTVRAF